MNIIKIKSIKSQTRLTIHSNGMNILNFRLKDILRSAAYILSVSIPTCTYAIIPCALSRHCVIVCTTSCLLLIQPKFFKKTLVTLMISRVCAKAIRHGVLTSASTKFFGPSVISSFLHLQSGSLSSSRTMSTDTKIDDNDDHVKKVKVYTKTGDKGTTQLYNMQVRTYCFYPLRHFVDLLRILTRLLCKRYVCIIIAIIIFRG